jgi:uncharacterized protein (TIRG00374 family)
MKSSLSAFLTLRPLLRRSLVTFAKIGAGVAVLWTLILFSKIDPKALVALSSQPAAVVCIVLVFATIPLASLRWMVLLHALGFEISFRKIYHVIAITNFFNAFLLGPLGGDVARAVYVWRIIGHSSVSVASSIVLDRLFGLFAALCFAMIYTVFNWSWMKEDAALFTLGISVALGFFGIIAVAGVLLTAPNLFELIEGRLKGWPRAVSMLGRANRTVRSACRRPTALLSVFLLALLSQAATILAVLVIGDALGIQTLRWVDYVLAVPVTLLANSLPLTPNGLGVGEAAFDQICSWLVPSSQNVAYSNAFFAFRILGVVASFSGLVSLFILRKADFAEVAGRQRHDERMVSEAGPSFKRRSMVER